MASPTPKSRSTSRPQPHKPSSKPSQRVPASGNDAREVVDPIWLLKAVGLTILAAFICGYLTLCLLFYQGQWQLVLHPTRSTPAPATIAGQTYQTIHFGIDETATPQLTGWLIPADASARYAAYTLLYLPSGDGALADATATLSDLHDIGINVFAFDYRGYGQSAPTRPNELRMTADAASAWEYLTVSRALPASHIVVFGDGVGASLAAHLGAIHPEVPAVILQSPVPEVIQAVLADPRTGSLPVHLLFNERFEVASTASKLQTPKLFLLNMDLKSPAASDAAVAALTNAASTPKMLSSLHAAEMHGSIYREQIVRFLDQHLR